MTREDAKGHLEWIPHFDEEKFVNEIYDDFESRTCENCNYFIDEKGTKFQFCNASTEGGIIGWNGYGKDFGCNKFERKTDGDV